MDHSASSRWPGTPVLAPPDVACQGSEWTSNELAQLAWRWHRVVVDRDVTDRLLALVLTNHPESAPRFLALAPFPADLVVLPGNPRAWQSSPPVPAGTGLVLRPTQGDLVLMARRLGRRPIVFPDARVGSSAVTAPPLPVVAPGTVLFTSGSTGTARPVYRSG